MTPTIRDRAGLERRACRCYHTVDHVFGQVIGSDGVGEFRP